MEVPIHPSAEAQELPIEFLFLTKGEPMQSGIEAEGRGSDCFSPGQVWSGKTCKTLQVVILDETFGPTSKPFDSVVTYKIHGTEDVSEMPIWKFQGVYTHRPDLSPKVNKIKGGK
jgi:hypothetical protein